MTHRESPVIQAPQTPDARSTARPLEFSGKTVLVTGASRGIGYSVAQAFATAGARVGVLAENAEIHQAAQALREATGADITALECDITDRLRLRSAVAAFGRLDVLVANAGTGDITPIDGPTPEVDDLFDRLIQINLIGAYNTVRAALPSLTSGSRIIFTSSVHGQGIAPPAMGAYTASKGGLDALMRSLARELGPRGITVNAVAPGMVATELHTRGRAQAVCGADQFAGGDERRGHDPPTKHRPSDPQRPRRSGQTGLGLSIFGISRWGCHNGANHQRRSWSFHALGVAHSVLIFPRKLHSRGGPYMAEVAATPSATPFSAKRR